MKLIFSFYLPLTLVAASAMGTLLVMMPFFLLWNVYRLLKKPEDSLARVKYMIKGITQNSGTLLKMRKKLIIGKEV